MPNIILGHTRTYICLYRKVGLLLRTEKRYLWLAEVNFRNCLSIIYMYTQRDSPDGHTDTPDYHTNYLGAKQNSQTPRELDKMSEGQIHRLKN